ncbi:MAG: site-2 protease family protein, partial [Alphaproteobacteria bacterium]
MNIYKLITASTWILPVITAVILHELAHGYAALRLGDDTALKQGRLSFNPLKHIDPLGTIILPLFLVIVNSPFIYGWAKPVPVSLLRLKKPKTSMAIVAAAGPLVNIFLAFSAVVLLKLASNFSLPDNELIGWVLINIRNAFIINLILAAFNL